MMRMDHCSMIPIWYQCAAACRAGPVPGPYRLENATGDTALPLYENGGGLLIPSEIWLAQHPGGINTVMRLQRMQSPEMARPNQTLNRKCSTSPSLTT